MRLRPGCGCGCLTTMRHDGVVDCQGLWSWFWSCWCAMAAGSVSGGMGSGWIASRSVWMSGVAGGEGVSWTVGGVRGGEEAESSDGCAIGEVRGGEMAGY